MVISHSNQGPPTAGEIAGELRAPGRRFLRIALALVAVAIVASTVSVWHSFRQIDALRTLTGKVESAYQVLLATGAVTALMTDAETGQRGYVLTGDESYLEPYQLGVAQVGPQLDQLASLIGQSDEQAARLVKARGLVAAKLGELDATVALRREGSAAEAIALIRSGEGKHLMDELRAVMEEIHQSESGRLRSRAAAIEPAARSLQVLLVIRAGVLVLLLGVAWVLNARLAHRQAQVTHSRNLLATTLASIGDGVIITDAQGRVTFLNAEAERLTGWKSGDAAGQNLAAIFRIVNETSRQPVESPVDKVLRLGAVVGLANHTVLIGKDGTEVPIDDSAAPIRRWSGDAGGTAGGSELLGVVLVFRDFSQHKALEQQLLDHQRLLETKVQERTVQLESAHHTMRRAERMAAVGSLAAGLAHDMRNVLLPLGLRMEVLRELPSIPGEAREDLAAVTALLDHLRAMARNLSLFAQDPEQEGVAGCTEVHLWCAQVKGLLNASVGREVQVHWDVPDDLPPVAVAPHRLTQAVQNLIHNARDAIVAARNAAGSRGTSDQGRIDVQVRRTTALGAPHLALKVTDNGCGMSEEVRQRCTEPFFTTKDRPQVVTGAGGSGLGMAIAHAVVERAGGFMEIDSTPGRGTSITLVLPMARAEG